MKQQARKTFSFFRWGCIGLALAAMVGVIVLYQQEIRDLFVDDTQYQEEIKRAAQHYHLDWRLVKAVVFQESRFNPDCIGKAGEVGLMQVLPGGAVSEWAHIKGFALPSTRELRRPNVNLEIGCFYLSRAMRRWRGYKDQTELALCQYNAGESRARRWAPADKQSDMVRNITIRSTRSYVTSIMKRYKRYCMEEKNAN